MSVGKGGNYALRPVKTGPASTLGANQDYIMRLATRVLLWLNRLFPQPDLSRYRDQYSYAEFQQMQAERNVAAFYRHLVDFRGRRVVDIGCGDGGKMIYVAGQGPRFICGVDIDPSKLALAAQFARHHGMDSAACQFLVGDGGAIAIGGRML